MSPLPFQKLTRFIKSQIDAILKKLVLVLYHRLEALDSELPDNYKNPHSPKGLEFSDLKSMVSASALALQSLNNSRYQECWICFSPQPPFYEDMLTFKNILFTNETPSLRWHSVNHEGLTLSQISGKGFCIRGPELHFPEPLQPMCSQTIIISQSSTYVAAPDGTYFACSKGLTTLFSTFQFLENKDYCVLVQLLPCLMVHAPEELLPSWEERPRHKRESISAITLAVMLGLRAAGAGTGIASLITSKQQYAHLTQLSQAVDKDIKELQTGLQKSKGPSGLPVRSGTAKQERTGFNFPQRRQTLCSS